MDSDASASIARNPVDVAGPRRSNSTQLLTKVSSSPSTNPPSSALPNLSVFTYVVVNETPNHHLPTIESDGQFVLRNPSAFGESDPLLADELKFTQAVHVQGLKPSFWRMLVPMVT